MEIAAAATYYSVMKNAICLVGEQRQRQTGEERAEATGEQHKQISLEVGGNDVSRVRI